MNARDEYQKKMEAQLREWNAKLDQLQARADRKAAEGKIEVYRQIDHLKGKRDELAAKVKELADAGEGSWEGLKATISETAEKFKYTLDDLFARR